MLFLNTVSCNGTDLFWPFFWWLLGAFLLGLLIPWLLRLFTGGGSDGNWKDKYDGLDGKYNVLHNSNSKLQKKYDAMKKDSSTNKGSSTNYKSKFGDLEKKFKELELGNTGLKTKYDSLLASAPSSDGDDWKEKYNDLEIGKSKLQEDYNALLAKSSSEDDTDWKTKYEELLANQDSEIDYGSGPNPDTGKRDDLTKIEGVGKKIQELLNEGGIYTFSNLAAANVKYLRKILDGAGPAYKVHQPGTWPEQSKMADEGKWDDLKIWQDELDGGV